MRNEIEIQIEAKVKACMEIVRKKFSLTSFATPSVHFDATGTKGGFAKYSDWSVHFNLVIAEANLEHYLNQTIPHEIAHLIDFQKYKGWGHKRGWKMIMKYVFGLEPKRCHNYDVSDVKKKKYDTYVYICKCTGRHIIKSNMHKKISLAPKTYKCVRCKTPIEFKEYIGKTQ